MDLFEALVRLDAAGWKTGPARPELADARSTPGLSRLLRRAGSLQPPDGSPAYDFTGEPGAGWAHGLPMVRLRAAADAETWMVLHADRASIWRVLPDGDPVLVARRLSDWLAGCVAGEALVPASELPRALWDLGLAGEGWGWSLEGVAPPTRLDRASLPEELRSAPLSVDDRAVWAGERVLERDLTDELASAPAQAPESAPGSPDVDELFGDGAGRPRPRTGLISTLLVGGLVLTVLGMACITAPGGLLVLIAWMHVEKDTERLESGYLPEEDRPKVERMRRFTYAGLVVVIALFTLQGLLLCNGAYDLLLDNLYLPAWQSFVRGLLEG